MKSAFRIYSDILQLRTEAFLALKHARGGMRYAAGMFFVVTLIAGAGLWIGLPAVLQQPLIVERIDQVSAAVSRFDREVVPSINESLEAVSQENINAALDELLAQGGEISAETLSEFMNRAGVRGEELADLLTAQAAEVGDEAGAQLKAQADALRQGAASLGVVTPEQMDELLARTELTAEQIANLAAEASLPDVDMERLRAQISQQAPQLEEWLAQIPLSSQQFQALLARVALSPERVTDVTLRLGLTQEQLETLQSEIDAVPDETLGLLERLRANVEQFHPPLGVRFSRFAHMFGEWLSTPFALLAQWAFFGLLLLVVAKLIGGTGSVRQHIIALLLTAAPLFLLFFTYVPDVTPAMSMSYNLAFPLFGRILAVLAVAWSAAILLKSMSVTHEFSLWRSLGAVGLTWLLIYVAFPVVSLWAVGYILRG